MTSYTVAQCDGEKDKFAFTVTMLILCDTDRHEITIAQA